MPTFPASLSAPGTFPVLRLEPQDSSCLVTLSGDYVGATVIFEASADGGASGNWPWSPAPGLRESKAQIDNFESALALTNGLTYTWRLDCLVPGATIRCRVVGFSSGTITMNARSGRFFLDSPLNISIPAQGAGSDSQTSPYATSDLQAGASLPMDGEALLNDDLTDTFSRASADYVVHNRGAAKTISAPDLRRQNDTIIRLLLIQADLLMWLKEPVGAKPNWGQAADALRDLAGQV